MGRASSHNLRGVNDRCRGNSRSQWQVGSGHPESVDGIRNVVDSLDDAVGVDVAVSSTSHSVPGLGLVLGRWATSISIAVLSQLILSVVLLADDRSGPLVGSKSRSVKSRSGHSRGSDGNGSGHSDRGNHLGGSVSGQMGSLGGSNFRSVDNGLRSGQNGHGSSGGGHWNRDRNLGSGVSGQMSVASGHDFRGVGDGCRGNSRSQWQVGGGHSEAVDGVGDVVDGLDDSVGVQVAVSSAGDTVPGLHLVFGGGAAGVTVAVLSEFVLSVVLAADNSGCCPVVVGLHTNKVVRVSGGQRHGGGQKDLEQP
jgi:hypothetical protein